jgi:two-component system, chemotaxis family, CheB/CheR fusion protein
MAQKDKEKTTKRKADGDPKGPEPTEQVDRAAMPVDHEALPKLAYPVVGIGASAGGLEAMTEFINAMRSDSGMAFVFIQHLPPERESMIADILAKKTQMLVQQVEEGMPINPDCVYVIRPGHVLTIKEGKFHLGEQLGARVANRPVDDFFKSLAEEQRERGIAVILSGMGSNGSAGAQAIKAVGGLVIAQDPETAQFPSMPRHLIEQGYADYILRPSEIPDVLLHYAGHPYARENRRDAQDQIRRNDNHRREILAILRTRTRQDFSGYKKPTILRRIQRRMGLTRLTDMGDYAKLLRQSPSEVTSLADDLLIHVTGFFRDHEAWETMREKVIAPLIARREAESEIRAWVTACSSGEEAYTLAMLLVEETERAHKPLGIKVFATDMAQRPLEHARAGIYPGGIESEIDPERLERFFDREDAVYRIKQSVRECVVFAPQNVLNDPPFSRLDIVSCRNLLIYLEPDVQQRVLNLLHFGLREGGALFLGSSETVSGAEGMYEVIDKRARIFRRLGPTRHGTLDVQFARGTRVGPAIEGNELTAVDLRERRGGGRASLAVITQRTLLEQHVAAAVTVDRDNRVLYFHGNTRPFLDQPAGEPTRDLLALTREGLRGSVRIALHRCAAEQKASTVLDGWVELSLGKLMRVAITASPVATGDPAHHDYYVVSFDALDEMHKRDLKEGEGAGNGDPSTAEDELRRVRDELHTTIEELQTSNEELKAANEEATSINEELQSTNEELETSKEEMQSLNEEMTTVNAQLQAKMEELQEASNDLSSLLESTDIAVLFLDTRFRIRRYTPAVGELFDMIAGDLGRPLADLHRKFEDAHLDEDVRTVLQRLVPIEREVAAANGKHYVRQALPYRTTDNRIDGVVLTFVDNSRRVAAERELHAAREYAQNIVETLHEPLLVLHADLTVKSANGAFYREFKVNPEQTSGRKIYELGNGQWNIPGLRKALEEVLPANKVFNGFQVEHTFQSIGHRVMLLNGRRLDHVDLILLGIRDITERHLADRATRDANERLKRMVNVEGVGVLVFDKAGVLIDANDAFLRMTGFSREDVAQRRLTWRVMTPPEHVEESLVQFKKLEETGRIGPYEKEYLRKDGTRSWMMFTGATVGDGTFVEYCTDVSERKRAEAARSESEARFRAVADLVPDLLWQHDPSGKVTWCNQRCLDYSGQSQEQVQGNGWLEPIHPQDRPRSREAFQHALQSGKPLRHEHRIRRASDGSYRWFLLQSMPIRDASGKILTWFGSATDVHEQRQAMESLEQFQALVRGITDYAIILFDPNNRVLTWNVGAEQLLGWTAEEAIGQEGSIIFTPEDRAAGAPKDEMEIARRDGRAPDERWHLRKDGSRFWGSGVMNALREPDGTLSGFVKIMRDDTARKQAEDELGSAKTQAESSSRVKDEFLATISHELRTPLAAVLLWAKMLRSAHGATAVPQLREGLDAIIASTESQTRLIEDLLDTSRIMSGKMRLDLRQVQASAVLRQALEAVRPAAMARDLKLIEELDADTAMVLADPDRLQQVFWNVLVNAVKFTPSGGTVQVILTRAGSNVQIIVRDTGKGIEPQLLPTLFNPFVQAEPAYIRGNTGLGLGLSIAKQLTELHAGVIAAESPGPGKGATFTITLPVARNIILPERSRISASPSGRRDPSEAKRLNGARILLVEDDDNTRGALERLLNGIGVKLAAFPLAKDALAAFKKFKPELIISDIGMADMDGVEFIRQVRATEKSARSKKHVPAVALSAFTRDQDRDKALAAGFQRHISKPVDGDALIGVLADLLSQQGR